MVMHKSVKGSYREFEAEANAFAGAFLLPEKPMYEELIPPVTLIGLRRLKLRWRVSIQAIVMRASDLGIITERQKTYLFTQMSKLGIRKREPRALDIPAEKPRALRQVAEMRYGVPIDYQELAKGVLLPVRLLQDTIGLYAGKPEGPAVDGKAQTIEFPRP